MSTRGNDGASLREFRCSCGRQGGHRDLRSVFSAHPLPWSYDRVEEIVDAKGGHVAVVTAMQAVSWLVKRLNAQEIEGFVAKLPGAQAGSR